MAKLTDINDVPKWQGFVERLIELTADKKLNWQPVPPHVIRDSTTSPLYQTIHKEWRILVYRYEYRSWDPQIDEWESMQEVAVELVDDHGRTLWRLPAVPNRFRLIDTLGHVYSNVEELYADLMGKSA